VPTTRIPVCVDFQHVTWLGQQPELVDGERRVIGRRVAFGQ
jgi:hypothetical protein